MTTRLIWNAIPALNKQFSNVMVYKYATAEFITCLQSRYGQFICSADVYLCRHVPCGLAGVNRPLSWGNTWHPVWILPQYHTVSREDIAFWPLVLWRLPTTPQLLYFGKINLTDPRAKCEQNHNFCFEEVSMQTFSESNLNHLDICAEESPVCGWWTRKKKQLLEANSILTGVGRHYIQIIETRINLKKIGPYMQVTSEHTGS